MKVFKTLNPSVVSVAHEELILAQMAELKDLCPVCQTHTLVARISFKKNERIPDGKRNIEMHLEVGCSKGCRSKDMVIFHLKAQECLPKALIIQGWNDFLMSQDHTVPWRCVV